jgi:hypothetical protein
MQTVVLWLPLVEIEGRCRKTDGGIMNRSSTAPDSKLKAKRIKVDSLVKAHTNWDFKNRRTTAPDNKLEGEFIRIP